MEDTAVTRVEGQNFKILCCLQVADFKENKGALQEANIQELIEPLIWEGCNRAFIKDIESKVKDFILSLFDLPNGIHKMDFKDDDDKEYKILCHKIKPVIFGFLLQPLSDEELREIEKNAKGKTYLTGDIADMFKTEKDFN